MLINGEKYACEACVRGHRVSSCHHSDRPLQHISKKGRPASRCAHCHGVGTSHCKRCHGSGKKVLESSSKPNIEQSRELLESSFESTYHGPEYGLEDDSNPTVYEDDLPLQLDLSPLKDPIFDSAGEIASFSIKAQLHGNFDHSGNPQTPSLLWSRTHSPILNGSVTWSSAPASMLLDGAQRPIRRSQVSIKAIEIIQHRGSQLHNLAHGSEPGSLTQSTRVRILPKVMHQHAHDLAPIGSRALEGAFSIAFPAAGPQLQFRSEEEPEFEHLIILGAYFIVTLEGESMWERKYCIALSTPIAMSKQSGPDQLARRQIARVRGSATKVNYIRNLDGTIFEACEKMTTGSVSAMNFRDSGYFSSQSREGSVGINQNAFGLDKVDKSSGSISLSSPSFDLMGFLDNETMDGRLSSSKSDIFGAWTEELVEVLMQKDRIRNLMLKGFQVMKGDHFERNLRNLLMSFAMNLRTEATGETQKSVMQLVLAYSTSAAFAIRTRLNDLARVQGLDNIQKLEASKFMWGKLLANTVDNSASKRGQEVIKIVQARRAFNDPERQVFSNLTEAKDFMVSSAAFTLFEEGLDACVYPSPAQSKVLSESLKDVTEVVDTPQSLEALLEEACTSEVVPKESPRTCFACDQTMTGCSHHETGPGSKHLSNPDLAASLTAPKEISVLKLSTSSGVPSQTTLLSRKHILEADSYPHKRRKPDNQSTATSLEKAPILSEDPNVFSRFPLRNIDSVTGACFDAHDATLNEAGINNYRSYTDAAIPPKRAIDTDEPSRKRQKAENHPNPEQPFDDDRTLSPTEQINLSQDWHNNVEASEAKEVALFTAALNTTLLETANKDVQQRSKTSINENRRMGAKASEGREEFMQMRYGKDAEQQVDAFWSQPHAVPHMKEPQDIRTERGIQEQGRPGEFEKVESMTTDIRPSPKGSTPIHSPSVELELLDALLGPTPSGPQIFTIKSTDTMSRDIQDSLATRTSEARTQQPRSVPLGFCYRLSIAPSLLRDTVTKIFRPKLLPNSRRVEWRCGCGDSLYADFKDKCDEEINRVAAILQHPINSSTQLDRAYNMTAINTTQVPSTVHIPEGKASGCSTQSGADSSLTLIGSSSSTSSSVLIDFNQAYLEVCINTGEYTKTLSEIDLRGIGCDGDLFKKIRSEYARLRGFRSRFWLLKPSGVHFVRFAVQDPLSVGILQKPFAIPPQCEVDAKHYVYSPCPLQDDPPMPQDIFLHYLSCTAYNPTLAWLPRLPKKLDPSILRFTGAINYGWGIHINEGPNYFAIGLINIFMMVISGVAAYLWKYFMNDFQGAFGFAGWIVAVVNAILVTYIMKWREE